MSWTIVIAKVLELLLPYIQKWLEDLLKESARTLEARISPRAMLPSHGIKALFAEARSRLGFWQWLWYGSTLNRYERVLTRRASELWQCAEQNTEPYKLTWAEIVELEGN